ncbi:Hypothetical protein (Fragment) [Durusdinium trenchii]|uniref:Altered inheritance of mitochondria protein 24, mitochondrial n=1 Tax=Durusdinium trenchii TaxID=1381693 RepID=A0ABP0KAU4_9DINO
MHSVGVQRVLRAPRLPITEKSWAPCKSKGLLEAFRRCVARTRTGSGLTGQGLLDGDRIMLLKVCGVGPIVPGFPNADIAIASGGGSSYSFGASDFITAGGGEYAMCWCQPGNGNVCTGPTNFLTNVGILIVTGAASDHDLSCVQGFDCQVTNFRGVGLADGDQIQVLLECGTGSSIANWPNQGIAVATGGGSEYLSWQGTSLAVQFGNYRICWCMLGWDCTTTAGFKMDAGALRVVGINPGQSRSCHVGAPCQIDALAGSNLRTGDLMKIMTTCGSGDEVRPTEPQKVDQWLQMITRAPNGSQTGA